MRETPYEREAGYAVRYRERRFTSGSGGRTDRRERAALRWLLDRAGAAAAAGPWLDVPCGAGRMSSELPQPVVLADRDPAMVRAAPAHARRLCASVHALPFRDGAFTGVLCHRLLQHIPTPAERIAILRELGRVGTLVVVSFFDAHSLQNLRRRLRPLLGKRRSGRFAVPRPGFAAELRAAGLRVLAIRALLRFASEQTLVLCRPEAGSGAAARPATLDLPIAPAGHGHSNTE